MRRSFAGLCLGLVLAALPAGAQAAPARIPAERIEVFAKARLAIDSILDKAHAELAEPRNKKDEAMEQLREKLRTDIAAALAAHGLTREEFDRYTFVASTDTAQRRLLDEAVTRLSTRKPAG